MMGAVPGGRCRPHCGALARQLADYLIKRSDAVNQAGANRGLRPEHAPLAKSLTHGGRCNATAGCDRPHKH